MKLIVVLIVAFAVSVGVLVTALQSLMIAALS